MTNELIIISDSIITNVFNQIIIIISEIILLIITINLTADNKITIIIIAQTNNNITIKTIIIITTETITTVILTEMFIPEVLGIIIIMLITTTIIEIITIIIIISIENYNRGITNNRPEPMEVDPDSGQIRRNNGHNVQPNHEYRPPIVAEELFQVEQNQNFQIQDWENESN